jgi:hypothetical protein
VWTQFIARDFSNSSVMFLRSSMSILFLQGSPVSWCKRVAGNNCLMYGHNDGRNSLSGDALSGWLVVNIPDVKEGFIFARLQVCYWN